MVIQVFTIIAHRFGPVIAYVHMIFMGKDSSNAFDNYTFTVSGHMPVGESEVLMNPFYIYDS